MSRRDVYSLLDEAGLRLMECLRLRVQDVDFSRKEIHVRDGKGAKDRITMLPETLQGALQEHLTRVKAVHEQDVEDGWGRVLLPEAPTASISTGHGTGGDSGYFPKTTDG